MSRIEELRNPEAKDSVLWQGHRPRMASAALAFSQAVYQETTLSFREAEAARFRIANIAGCMICKGFRVADGLEALLERLNVAEQANLSAQRGEAPGPDFYVAVEAWRTSDLLSARERLAAEYAERLDREPGDLPYDEDFWARIHAHYDDAEIVDLTYSIVNWIAGSRFVHGLGLDGSCPAAPVAAPVLQAS